MLCQRRFFRAYNQETNGRQVTRPAQEISKNHFANLVLAEKSMIKDRSLSQVHLVNGKDYSTLDHLPFVSFIYY